MASDAPQRPVLVSACLLGQRCRYDGGHQRDAPLLRLLAERGETPVPFCPEEAGGLGTPRPPAWLGDGAARVLDGRARVETEGGDDVTEAFRRGAQGARARCAEVGATRAYLKERSPSCGVRHTHVAGRVAAGPGVTAACLSRAGVEVIGVEGGRED